jgi:hypothetical protein
MAKYKCSDCDNFNACKYYHHRKGTSKICSEFDDSISIHVRIENIHSKLRAYIKGERINIDIYDVNNMFKDNREVDNETGTI